MTIAELLAAFEQECPNGVSFEPMALRLLKQRVPFDDCQIEGLKAEMLQLGNGRWFSVGMIINDLHRRELEELALRWVIEYKLFSAEKIYEHFSYALRHISSLEDCVALLKRFGFTVEIWENSTFFCFFLPTNLGNSIFEISKVIAELLEFADGILPLHEIEQTMPHLTEMALDCIRRYFLFDVYKVEIGGVHCWSNIEAIPVPEDFSDKLTSIIDTLTKLNEKVSVANIEFALNLFYCVKFREEYALLDNDTFKRVCVNHYKGKHGIFRKTGKPIEEEPSSMLGKHGRSPNSCFRSLNVPIGSELTFTRNNLVTCRVYDSSNKVEHDGKVCTISALAKHLLGVPSANGYAFFSFEGETLWDRRLRLERESKESLQAIGVLSKDDCGKTEDRIIGLQGKMIAPTTWYKFRRDGNDPRVVEWSRRVEKGESVEQIALESGYEVSSIKGMLSNHRLYYSVCAMNSILPEGGLDV